MGFTAESPVVAGTVLVRSAIQSPNYVTTVSGWAIMQDGSAEFNNVVVRGEVDVNGDNSSRIRILDISGTPYVAFYPSTFTNPIYNIPNPGLIAGDSGAFPDHLGRLILSSPKYATGAVINLIGDSFETGFAETQIDLFAQSVTKQSIDIGGGVVATVQSSATSAAITTETVVMSLPPTTYFATRAYRVYIHGGVFGNTTGAAARFMFKKTNTGGQLICDLLWTPCPTVSTAYRTDSVFEFTVGAADVTGAVLVLTLASSSGTMTHYGAAGAVRSISVADVGLASTFPGATVLV